MAVETVDANLRKATVLTVVLDAHAGLEGESLRQARGIGPFEQPRVQHAYQRRSFAPQRRRTAGRDDHFVHRNAALHHLEIEFQRLALFQRDGHLRRGIAQRTDFERQFADRKVFQEIVPRSIGRRAESRTDDSYRGIGNVFMGFTVHNVAEKIRVRALARRIGAHHAGDSQAHRKEPRQDMSFHMKISNNE